MSASHPADLTALTWPEARSRFGPDLFCLIPVGSTEPHGPHLPLDVDVTIAAAQARRAAERLRELGQDALVLPALPYGVTFFTDGFEGRVTIRPGTLWAILEDLIESLSEQGVRRVLLCNGHLEPAHVKVLRGIALDYAEDRDGKAKVVFPDNTRRRWAGTLGDEFASGDCHAGRYESSIVLAADPPGERAACLARGPCGPGREDAGRRTQLPGSRGRPGLLRRARRGHSRGGPGPDRPTGDDGRRDGARDLARSLLSRPSDIEPGS
ncbi:MAG: creatininase family protein, partial [Planctomycetota bacterium]